ncbi:CU044_5270 family protein [Streptomyces asoensis]|uniref:CU044_5270 family protein n=1 Tax=Streptomyces asoensis TaxID=249586 RepID=UPI00378AA298
MARKRPDVMETLAKARPEELDPARLAGSDRARDDLLTIMSGPRETRETGGTRTASGPPVFGRRWVLPVAATAVAAAVVVGTLAEGTSGSEGTRTSAGPSATGAPAGTPADGRLALLTVAARLDRTANAGAYWQVTTRSASVGVIAEPVPGISVVTAETQRYSYGVKSGARSVWVSGIDASTQPRTARDRQRWEAAGSPKELTLATGPSGGRLGVRIETARENTPTTATISSGDRIAALGARNVTYADLRELPGDPEKLKRVLADLHAQDRDGETSDRTEWTWQQAANLIRLPVGDDVRAAAYRVIADLPGIVSLGEVTDPTGRKGAGFALPATGTPDYGSVRPELIVDPGTGALLAERRTVVKPSAAAAAAGITAGTPVDYTVTVEAKWTDARPTGQPTGGR